MWRDYKGIGGVVRALLFPVVRHAATPAAAATWIATAALCSGCIIPAPIEEEIPEEDLPPFVDQLDEVDPPLGEITIDLAFPPTEEFSFFDVQDPNEEQTLYWKSLVVYGGVSVAGQQFAIPPDERDRAHTFFYRPCEGQHGLALDVSASPEHALVVIGISDAPFASDNQFFLGELDPVEAAMSSVGETPVSFIVWGVNFVGGPCPQ